MRAAPTQRIARGYPRCPLGGNPKFELLLISNGRLEAGRALPALDKILVAHCDSANQACGNQELNWLSKVAF